MKSDKFVLLLLRFALAYIFLYSGITKYVEGFTATGFLLGSADGTFGNIYIQMANNIFVDALVVSGQLLIGTSLALGVFLRVGAYSGITMMLLFYLASLPPERGYIDQHIVYILVLLLLATYGAGRYFGLDKYLERTAYVKKNPLLKYLLG